MRSTKGPGPLTLALLLILLLTLLPAGAGAQPPEENGPDYVPGELVIKLKGDAKPFRVVKLPPGESVLVGIARHKGKPNVVFAEPNYVYRAFMVPNDPYYRFQWHMQNPAYGGIHTEAAWDTAAGLGAVVAVVDTGVAYETYGGFVQAPDLAGTAFVPGYDFVGGDTHPNDDNGHGTHVTGTIGQSTNNGVGVTGVAFGAAVMPVKVLDRSGSGTSANVAYGIRFAADRGADVVNLSLGGPASTVIEQAVAYARSLGVTVIAAAGNDGKTTVSYPAAYDQYVIAVSATRYDEAISYYSNTGSSIDLAAPGGDTRVDQNGDGYVDGVLQQTLLQTFFGADPTQFRYYFFQGTSMAAPHVSGVAALLVGLGVTNPTDVKNVLQSTAEDHGAAGWDPSYGWGIVDAARAVAAAARPNTPPTANPGGPYLGTEDIAVLFDGTGSSDPEGDPLTYRWNFGDGATATGPTPAHAYAAGGTYTVTLTVNDGRADSAPVTTTATVAEVNDAPVANAGPDKSALVGQTVSFDGSGSSDIDGSIVSYAWDFGDGATATGPAVAHAYTATGTYLVTLAVTDNLGATGTDTALVTVRDVDPATLLHVGNIAMSAAKKGERWQATGVVTILDGNNAAVSGATVNAAWSGAYSGTASGTTDAAGKVTFKSGRVLGSLLKFTLTVTGVSKAGYTYDSASNVETSDSVTTP